MPTLGEIRRQYPQYGDMSDDDLASALHRKFYSDMPREEFDRKVGFEKPDPSMAEVTADVGKGALRGINKGLANLITAPYRLPAWAIEKTTGYQLPNYENFSVVPGLPYKWGDFTNPPEAETTTGRYVQAAGEGVGGAAIPTAGLLAAAPRIVQSALPTVRQATQTLPGLVRRVAEPFARSPKLAVAADAAAAAGAGIGQEAARSEGFGRGGQFVAGMMGAFAPLAVGGVASGMYNALSRARAGSTPYARVANKLGDVSIDDLSEGIATGATRIQADIHTRALDILGQEMVRAGGNRQAAIPATIARIANEQSVTPQTAREHLRRLTGAQRESELFFGEYPTVAQSNIKTRLKNPRKVTDEAAGAIEDVETQWLTDTIASAGGKSASRIRNAITSRLEPLREQFRERLARMSPSGQTIQDADLLIEGMKRAAQKEYDAVYNAPPLTTQQIQAGVRPVVNYGRLHKLLGGVVDKHLDRMYGRGGEQKEALQRAINEFMVDTPQGRVLLPSLQMMQDMRGVVRGMITEADRAGRSHIVSTLQPFYDDITRIMKIGSPQWAKANERWADLSIDKVARELGEAFAEKAGPKFRKQMQQFGRLAPEAKDFVRIEFTQKLLDKIENNPATHDLAKLFNTPHVKNMVRTLLGNDAAVDFARLIRDNQVATRSKNMLGGSPTQPRQMRQAEQDADLGLIAAADNLSVQGVRGWLIQQTINRLRDYRNRKMAGIVTTPMRDTPAIAEHLERMRRAQARQQLSTVPTFNALGVLGGTVGQLPALD